MGKPIDFMASSSLSKPSSSFFWNSAIVVKALQICLVSSLPVTSSETVITSASAFKMSSESSVLNNAVLFSLSLLPWENAFSDEPPLQMQVR